MTCFNWMSPRAVAATVAFLALTFCLGLVPWKANAAEPQDGAKQPEERVAKIEVLKREKGEPKVVLASPKIVFIPGQEARLEMGDETRRLELAVRSLLNEKPMQHEVDVRIVRDPEGKKPVVMAAPKITLIDGATGSVVIGNPEGSALEINVTVGPPTK